ncbi:hypothetical protein AMTRI_Chr05g67820 [Amborella trichopoda]
MKSLKYLNLENNNFQGPIPFNSSFIKKPVVFKVGRNSYLCYNYSIVSSKPKLGIAKCDSFRLPITPDSASDAPSSSQNYDTSDDDSDVADHTTHHHHGPNTIVLVVIIGLCSIIFLIIFCALLSKWCS